MIVKRRRRIIRSVMRGKENGSASYRQRAVSGEVCGDPSRHHREGLRTDWEAEANAGSAHIGITSSGDDAHFVDDTLADREPRAVRSIKVPQAWQSQVRRRRPVRHALVVPGCAGWAAVSRCAPRTCGGAAQTKS